jgi:bifunctional non-homologous end joining protein LigD
MLIKDAFLIFKEGNSDKVYQVQLLQEPDGCVVKFQYGRRGSTLQSGTKTATPVELSEAQKIFNALLKEKTGKGYQLAAIGNAGTEYQKMPAAKVASGLVPQLLNPIDEAEALRLIENDGWFMQEKADGHHQMARIDSSSVTGSNRKGEVIPLASSIATGLCQMFNGTGVADGEAVGDTFHVFDLIEEAGNDLRSLGAWKRYERLSQLFWANAAPYKGAPYNGKIVIVRTASTKTEKRELYQQIMKEGGEGVVFKRKNAPYVSGRPNSGGSMLKLKFVASATCTVLGQNGSKSSVVIGIKKGDQTLKVGHVTIPPNHEIPATGQLVEVRYLYAYAGGSLVQAVYLGPREDKDAPDQYSSLKFKQGHAV